MTTTTRNGARTRARAAKRQQRAVGGTALEGLAPPATAPEPPELTIEQRLNLLAWLHAEQHERIMRLAVALSALLVQTAQPRLQQQMLGELMG